MAGTLSIQKTRRPDVLKTCRWTRHPHQMSGFASCVTKISRTGCATSSRLLRQSRSQQAWRTFLKPLRQQDHHGARLPAFCPIPEITSFF
jgi:hypothetical protein